MNTMNEMQVVKESAPATAPSYSRTEERALVLLGSGLPAEQVANTLGVDPSRISQLMGQEHFRTKVMELRFNNLQAQNQRDSKADGIEDKLLDKLESNLSLMFKPMEILKAYQILNGAKRRGQTAPAQLTNQQTVVQLMVPQRIIQQFVVNQQNQVVKAGEQELLTMQSGPLIKEAQARLNALKSPELQTLSSGSELQRTQNCPSSSTLALNEGNNYEQSQSSGVIRNDSERTDCGSVGGAEQVKSRSNSQINFVPVR